MRVKQKIVWDTGKTFIPLVWLLPSLCSGIKLHTRKINFFSPSCTICYFILPGHKVNFISRSGTNKKSRATREKHLFYSCVYYPRFARASNLTLANGIFFSLVAQYIISYYRVIKRILFTRAGQQKIVCDTGKTFILLVWLLPSLSSGIKLHTRK